MPMVDERREKVTLRIAFMGPCSFVVGQLGEMELGLILPQKVGWILLLLFVQLLQLRSQLSLNERRIRHLLYPSHVNSVLLRRKLELVPPPPPTSP